jgi:hypothetical protein
MRNAMLAKRILAVSAAAALVAVPLAASAAGACSNVTSCTAASAGELLNGSMDPCCYTWELVFSLGTKIIQLLIQIATVAAAMFVMYGGWLYLTSGGDSSKVQKAHDTLKNAGIGLALLVAAWLIVTGIISSLEGKSWLKNFFPGIGGGN